MSQYNAFEQEVLNRLEALTKELADLKKLLTPAEVDPFQKVKILQVAADSGRNAQSLARRAKAKGWLVQVPGMGHVNYIEHRHINALLKKAS